MVCGTYNYSYWDLQTNLQLGGIHIVWISMWRQAQEAQEATMEAGTATVTLQIIKIITLW